MKQSTVNWRDPIAAAKLLKANWNVKDFGWNPNADNKFDWYVGALSHRDSDLLEKSNAAFIERKFAEKFPLTDEINWFVFRSGHWAVDHVDQIAIRVYEQDQSEDDEAPIITDEFEEWCNIQARLDNYCVLDEEDWDRRQQEALEWAIEDAGKQWLKEDHNDQWIYMVQQWLEAHFQGELDDRNGGTGAYPNPIRVWQAMQANDLLEPDTEPFYERFVYITYKFGVASFFDAITNEMVYTLVVPNSSEWGKWMRKFQEVCNDNNWDFLGRLA